MENACLEERDLQSHLNREVWLVQEVVVIIEVSHWYELSLSSLVDHDPFIFGWLCLVIFSSRRILCSVYSGSESVSSRNASNFSKNMGKIKSITAHNQIHGSHSFFIIPAFESSMTPGIEHQPVLNGLYRYNRHVHGLNKYV